MKHLFILTEERSLKIVLETLLPMVLPENVLFRVIPHDGKQDLERSLPKTIPGLSKVPEARIIISRDKDESDCVLLKEKLVKLINDHCQCPYKIRIVCKNLESWFLGDLPAVQSAYNRFQPGKYQMTSDFRDVDSIGNPTQLLQRIVPELQNSVSLPKLKVAREISAGMVVDRNKSISFINFFKAIRSLINDGDKNLDI